MAQSKASRLGLLLIVYLCSAAIAEEIGKTLSRETAQKVFAEMPKTARHPKSLAKIRAKIAAWEIDRSEVPKCPGASPPLPPSAGELRRWRELCLRRLKIYRFLCDVPSDDLELDAELNRQAEAAVRLCDDAKQISHTPPNPGWPAAEYEYAIKAAANSNLCTVGCGDLLDALDLYMYDSNATNISHVGHRRWMLNPHQQRCGFAWGKEVTAYLAHDSSRQGTPPWDFVCFPPRGYMPVRYFRKQLEKDYIFRHQGYAWHVGLNPERYAVPTAETGVAVFALDEEYLPQAEAIPLEHFAISALPLGDGGAVIFRPRSVEVAAGKRYGVLLDGLRWKNGTPAPSLAYVVEFVALAEEESDRRSPLSNDQRGHDIDKPPTAD